MQYKQIRINMLAYAYYAHAHCVRVCDLICVHQHQHLVLAKHINTSTRRSKTLSFSIQAADTVSTHIQCNWCTIFCASHFFHSIFICVQICLDFIHFSIHFYDSNVSSDSMSPCFSSIKLSDNFLHSISTGEREIKLNER